MCKTPPGIIGPCKLPDLLPLQLRRHMGIDIHSYIKGGTAEIARHYFRRNPPLQRPVRKCMAHGIWAECLHQIGFPQFQCRLLLRCRLTAFTVESRYLPTDKVISNFSNMVVNTRFSSPLTDISIISVPGKLNDKGCTGAPDWIIEIVSPKSRCMDYFTKPFKYRTASVRENWIVDPEKNRILVYNFESEDT